MLLYRISFPLITIRKNITKSIMEYSFRPHRNQNDVNNSKLNIDEVLQNEKNPQELYIENFTKLILHLDEHYCVINKPPYIRMDGAFDITVEKLVSSWLNRSIKEIKWVHQLDYATSGVLCIALSKPAAAAACSSFEYRKTSKEYLAVLQGHLDIENYPISDKVYNKSLLTQEMLKSRTDKRNFVKEKDSIESSWQLELMETNLKTCVQYLNIFLNDDNSSCEDSLKEKKSNFLKILNKYLISQDRVQADFARNIKSYTLEKFIKSPKQRKILRKMLNQAGVELQLLPSDEKSFLHVTNKDFSEPSLPSNSDPIYTEEEFFRISSQYSQTNFDLSKNHPYFYRHSSNPNKLIIDVPIYELSNDFRMLPSGAHDNYKGKLSVTEVTILEKGTYNGQPVTKVKFCPISGRRHQLRIHSLCLGFPIVGDFTYNKAPYPSERMMLHAVRLKIFYSEEGNFKDDFKNKYIFEAIASKKDSCQCEDPPYLDVESQDPFPFLDGTLSSKFP